MKFANYIDNISAQQDFARPILTYLREYMNEGCPYAKEEFKWNMPYFTYRGSILASMASFKSHATFGFSLAPQMKDPKIFSLWNEKSGMDQFGKIPSLEELPGKDILLSYIQEAMVLNEQGKKHKINDASQKKTVPHAPEIRGIVGTKYISKFWIYEP